MTKSQKIRNRIRYWIKLLNLKKKFIIKEATKKEQKEYCFSGYLQKYKKHITICFNPNVITLKDISNNVDRVILHELGHVYSKQINSKKISIENEYNAEKWMLSILYKYNIKLYKKTILFMHTFLSKDELQSYIYAWKNPEHYQAFCKIYNIERVIL